MKQLPILVKICIRNQAQSNNFFCSCDVNVLLIHFRCKSYELGALIEKLLGKSLDQRHEVDCDVMKQAYSSSKSLISVAGLCLQDTADMLQVRKGRLRTIVNKSTLSSQLGMAE